MRRALAVAAALIAALFVLPVAPAHAGGPTSVLVVNHENSRAGAALTGSAAYEDLSRALDVYGTPTGESRPEGAFMGSSLRLTWFIHDVTAWRVDAITFDGPDVWVSTSTMGETGSGTLFEQPTVWHRPADQKLLLATLTTLGVIGEPAATGTKNGSADGAATGAARPDPGAVPAEDAAAAEVPAVGSSGAGSSTGVPFWTLAVAVAGALGIGALGGRLVRRAPPSEPERDAEGRTEADPEEDSGRVTVGFTTPTVHGN